MLLLRWLLLVRLASAIAKSEDNIHLFKSEIAAAMEGCGGRAARIARSSDEGGHHHRLDYDDRFDAKNQGESWGDPRDDRHRTADGGYAHERRSSSNAAKNSTKDWDEEEDEDERGGFKSVKELNFTTDLYDPYMTRGARSRRFAGLGGKNNADDECLSQCVFANLQVVDDKGLPKETLFLKFVQDNVTSQQSKLMMEKLIQDCFRELISESVENECIYSNTLDSCMDLKLKKRKTMADEDAAKAVPDS